jgi:hypothetical protein
VYQYFDLVFCDGSVYCNFIPDNSCTSCLIPVNIPQEKPYINFCDTPVLEQPSCLVGIINSGENGDRETYKQNCYIEVFFLGIWDTLTIPFEGGGEVTYKSNTIIASLRWSATAQFMDKNGGAMLNCTNHTT